MVELFVDWFEDCFDFCEVVDLVGMWIDFIFDVDGDME